MSYFLDIPQLTEISYFLENDIEENIIFSLISDIFRNKWIGQDFDDKKLIK